MGTCFTMKMGTCSTMKMGTCFTINTHIVLDPPRSHAVGAGSRELGEQIHHDRTCGRSLQLLHARACYALRSLLRTVQPVQSRPVRISTPDSLTWPCSHAPHLLTCALTYLPAHSPTYLRTRLLICLLTYLLPSLYYLRTHFLTCCSRVALLSRLSFHSCIDSISSRRSPLARTNATCSAFHARRASHSSLTCMCMHARIHACVYVDVRIYMRAHAHLC